MQAIAAFYGQCIMVSPEANRMGVLDTCVTWADSTYTNLMGEKLAYHQRSLMLLYIPIMFKKQDEEVKLICILTFWKHNITFPSEKFCLET